MARLASRFGATNVIRKDRPLTRDELFQTVPSIFIKTMNNSDEEKFTNYGHTLSALFFP